MSRTESVFDQIKRARLAKGMTQAEVADVIECGQSAVSKFEGGRLDALSDEKILQLAKTLGVEVDLSKASKELVLAGSSRPSRHRHCASPWCPAVTAYRVHADLVLWPAFIKTASPDDARYCEVCGEPMLERCWKCSAPVTKGAFCSICHAPRVRLDAEIAAELIEQRKKVCADIGEVQDAVAKVEEWHRQRHEAEAQPRSAPS
jgi:transcriptional regulator with XRE-family HTH domain